MIFTWHPVYLKTQRKHSSLKKTTLLGSEKLLFAKFTLSKHTKHSQDPAICNGFPSPLRFECAGYQWGGSQTWPRGYHKNIDVTPRNQSTVMMHSLPENTASQAENSHLDSSVRNWNLATPKYTAFSLYHTAYARRKRGTILKPARFHKHVCSHKLTTMEFSTLLYNKT